MRRPRDLDRVSSLLASPSVAVHSTIAPSRRSGGPPTGSSSLKFGVVGASGYVVNLVVYTSLLGIGAHKAAAVSFVVVGGEQLLVEPSLDVRRLEGQLRLPGHALLRRSAWPRSSSNQLWLFVFLDWLGLGKIVSQALAIVLVMPLNFIGNKLWSFRR